MLNKEEYVIVNLWPVDKDKPLEDDNIGHVSVLTCFKNIEETYTSLWSGTQPNETGFLHKKEHFSQKMFLDFAKRRPSFYQQDYEQDCAFEAMRQGQVRHIVDIRGCKSDETPFLVNLTTGTLKKLTTQPETLQPEEEIRAIKLVPASIRVVLYSLDSEKVKDKFDDLKSPNQIAGWSMTGSNLYIKNINFNGKNDRNCASIAFYCLKGLWFSEILAKAPPPKDLLKRIARTKLSELHEYRGSPDEWKVPGLDETSIQDLRVALNPLDQKTNKTKPKLSLPAQSKKKYQKARCTLEQLCESYVTHNESQLNALPKVTDADIHGNFSFNRSYPKSGFSGWVAFNYIILFESILSLGSIPLNDNIDAYPACVAEREFFPYEDRGINPQYFNERNYVTPSLLIGRLNILHELLYRIVLDVNKEPDFSQKLEEYQANNENHHLCLESDPPSVQAYKILMKLKTLMNFVQTLPQYHSKEKVFLFDYFNESLPTFDGYIKGIAVQELQAILNDPTSNDEEAINEVALRLKDPITLEILEKNRQSKAEQILKVIAVVLIPLGIGVIPTLFLVSKRLYDSGGTSINFFKSLSENLCEDANKITSNIKECPGFS